jgi:prevent-host-death family protein
MVREIKASEFKAKCLKLMDEVNETGDVLVITKNGKPVARLLPERTRPSPFGRAEGKIRIHGDIIGPFFEEWGEEDPLKKPGSGQR